VNCLISAACSLAAFAYDDLLLLDGNRRVVEGQHAGIDFYNPLGLFWKLIGAHRWLLAVTSGAFNGVTTAYAAATVSRRLAFSRRYCSLVYAVLAFEASSNQPKMGTK
jgi:hypothetical protein